MELKRILICLAVVASICCTSLFGQDVPIKAIDAKAKRVFGLFIKDAVDLADEYERNGNLERARQIFEAINKLDSNAPGINDKIKALQDSILNSNQQVHDLDTTKGWTQIGIAVGGKSFRVVTAGTYEINLEGQLTVAGLPTGDVKTNGMDNDFPLGALIGLFVDKKGKPGKVFLIGSEARLSPNQDSVFFVKLNLPPAAKVEGEIKVGTSGWLNVPVEK